MAPHNVRRGKRPSNTSGQKVVLAILMFVFVMGFIMKAALVLASKITGEPVPENLSLMPFAIPVGVLKGYIPWNWLASTFTVLIVILVAALGWTLRWVFKGSSKSKARIDDAMPFLADGKDRSSFAKSMAVAQSKKWIKDPVLAVKKPGLLFGVDPRNGKQQYWSTWEDLYLVIFGPRMGKTTTQVIPAIVDAPGNVVTTSNKRDIVDDTIKITQARGQVYVFDPQRIAAGFAQEPWYFDPLDMVRQDPAVMDAAASKLADIFMTAEQGDNQKGDAYFSGAGKELLARFFLAAAVGNLPIGIVFEWASDAANRESLRYLRDEWPQQYRGLMGQYNLTDKTRSGVFGQAAQMVASLGRAEALKWVEARPGARKFNPDAFVRGKSDTLYILSKEGADSAAALSTALTAAVMMAAERYGEQNGGRLPVPLVAPLDEAANVVRWPELPKLYSHYGSRSIILMTILQSYAQGVSVWGEEGMEALWSAAALLIYGGGVRDEKMLGKMESLIGEAQEITHSASRSRDGTSLSRQVTDRKIITVSELAALEAGRAVVFATKRRPLLIRTVPFWERTWWPDEVKAAFKKL